ncbi:PIR Superfamily Protein [Plasmodium ovale curtisi]|uniref:PIR Superfamily Protein n=1 Tax=Plasmodium ovale curtisi TaxID=864141 RepID=A0A1A8VN52_PLAOA|nr:PIR Superfamily Protein [Plasmodium ovale curtisi]
MTCPNWSTEELNKFFETKFDDCAELLETFKHENVKTKSKNGCNSFVKDDIFRNISSLEKICEQFKDMYDSLYGNIGESSRSSSDKYVLVFLNYWLNDKLRDKDKNILVSVQKFYEKIKENDSSFFKDNLLYENLCNMEYSDFEYMKVLYELYNYKRKIHNIMINGGTDQSAVLCEQYTKACYLKYKESIYKCLNGSYNFLKDLKTFKRIYEISINKSTDHGEKCKPHHLIPLPEYDDVLREYNNPKKEQFQRIITITILVPLLALSFPFISSNTFTPMRQYVSEKIKKTRNILMNMDENRKQFLLHSPDFDNEISDNGEHKIGYYSVRNF